MSEWNLMKELNCHSSHLFPTHYVHFPKSSPPPVEDNVIISFITVIVDGNGYRAWITCIEKEDWIRLCRWLAAHLIAPGAGLQISPESLLKTDLLPAVTINRAACLLCQSRSSRCLTRCQVSLRHELCRSSQSTQDSPKTEPSPWSQCLA